MAKTNIVISQPFQVMENVPVRLEQVIGRDGKVERNVEAEASDVEWCSQALAMLQAGSVEYEQPEERPQGAIGTRGELGAPACCLEDAERHFDGRVEVRCHW